MRSETKVGLLFILPVVVLILFVYFYPLLNSLYISFHRWILPLIPTKGTPFVGFSNYASILTSSIFRNSLTVTLYYVGVSVGLSLLIGLGMALVVNENFKGRGILRGIFLVPFLMAPVASAIMWKWMFDYSAGVINSLFMQTGIGLIPWLSNPFLALNSAVLVTSWYWAPWVMIILLGGLQSTPVQLYKAAKVDGANALNRFRHVTLPFLFPFIGITTIFQLAVLMRLPDIIYVLTAGGPGGFTKVLSYTAWEQSFKYTKFGIGSAIGYFIMIISLIAIGVVYYLLRHRGLKYV